MLHDNEMNSQKRNCIRCGSLVQVGTMFASECAYCSSLPKLNVRNYIPCKQLTDAYYFCCNIQKELDMFFELSSTANTMDETIVVISLDKKEFYRGLSKGAMDFLLNCEIHKLHRR